MASSSAGAGGLGSRRGLISCLHSPHCRVKDSPLLSDEDLPHAIYKLIRRFYKEAFKRLPCDAMPELLNNGGGGSCLGLLDPVSNIILNVIALLPPKPKDDEAPSADPPAAEINTKIYWREVACQSLLDFLMAYFGCLTKVQATRYLYRADANPLLALMLIQHDLYAAEGGELFDPESDRTQAALEHAATMAGHPAPTTLANLMSIHLKDTDFALMKKRLFSTSGGLSVKHVWAIHRIAHKMMKPVCFANIVHTKRKMVISYAHILEAYCSETTARSAASTTSKGDACVTTSTTLSWVGTPISSLQLESVLTEKLQDCLRIAADEQKHYLKKKKKKTPCDASSCDYHQSLDMFVHAIIHNLYIKVLKMLPTPSGPLMRSILKAGHCYGCMDPVSNIIVNSIWYDTCGCDLPLSERMDIKQYNDVLDPLCLLRAQVHSLKGLTKLAAFADPQFSSVQADYRGAVELLCSTKCDIANTLTASTEIRSDSLNPFHEAAVAAGHPLPVLLGELHQQLQLMPDERRELLSYITEAKTNGTVLRVDDMTRHIAKMWKRINRSNTSQTVKAPVLGEVALTVVSSERSKYDKERGQLRLKIQQLLKKYMTQQFPGPEYKLGTILGVEKRTIGHNPRVYDIQYNVNFTATHDLKRHRTLFFAEFWSLSSCPSVHRLPREPKPAFCCPLPYAYAGRCYYDVHIARKIVYPDDAKYIRDDDDITDPGTRSVDYMLGMDLVYFSPEFDVELGENLNMRPSEEEQKKRRRLSYYRYASIGVP